MLTNFITNKNSIFYTERANFDFLLKNEYWFSSGTAGLHRLKMSLIGCYTTERKINYLNDLTSFIKDHHDEIMKIHEKTLNSIRMYKFDNHMLLCIAAVYNVNDEMRDNISKALLKLLEILDLKSYHIPKIFESLDNDELRYQGCSTRKIEIPKIYDCIKSHLNNCLLDENLLTINKLTSLAEKIYYGHDIFGFHNTKEIMSRAKNRFDGYVKEITMASYESIHKIMSSM